MADMSMLSIQLWVPNKGSTLHEQTSHLALSLGHFKSFKTSQQSRKATLHFLLLFSGGGGGVEEFQPALVWTVFSGWTPCSLAAIKKALISACTFNSLHCVL